MTTPAESATDAALKEYGRPHYQEAAANLKDGAPERLAETLTIPLFRR